MTSCESVSGWGVGWGVYPYGAGEDTDLRLIYAEPVRDNVVRIRFNLPVKFTGVLDSTDASNPRRYGINVDTSSVGYDGLNARPVKPIKAELAAIAGANGTIVDITVDRPFSPYPSRYSVSVNGLVGFGNNYYLNACYASMNFNGLYRKLQNQASDLVVPSRDIANPNTLSALLDPLPLINPLQLGIIPVDDSGDYGFDEGITNLKKRIIRRMITAKGSFTFLPDYGVGIPQRIKRLNTASGRQELASECQIQISKEPEVSKCVVQALQDSSKPSLVIFKVLVKVKGTNQAYKFGVPFNAV